MIMIMEIMKFGILTALHGPLSYNLKLIRCLNLS